ncbi:hypothetical protein LC55x_2496 [Lysobacter capsici]|nr:hypothetical protein LC55x_2496 [Lysobacter capsici]
MRVDVAGCAVMTGCTVVDDSLSRLAPLLQVGHVGAAQAATTP